MTHLTQTRGEKNRNGVDVFPCGGSKIRDESVLAGIFLAVCRDMPEPRRLRSGISVFNHLELGTHEYRGLMKASTQKASPTR